MIRISKSSRGAALVEYGLLVGLIAVVAIASVGNLGERVATAFRAPAANVDWYVLAATSEYPARYLFTAAPNAGRTVIGFDIDGISGAPYGGLSEAEFDEFNLRSLQYRDSTKRLSFAMSGDTTSTAPGHVMTCIDLSDGETKMQVDFDAAPGFYNDFYQSTTYSVAVPSAPFVADQELACLIKAR